MNFWQKFFSLDKLAYHPAALLNRHGGTVRASSNLINLLSVALQKKKKTNMYLRITFVLNG